MNTSSRVPGISRNSGWLAIDAEIVAHRLGQRQDRPMHATARGNQQGNVVQPWVNWALTA